MCDIETVFIWLNTITKTEFLKSSANTTYTIARHIEANTGKVGISCNQYKIVSR